MSEHMPESSRKNARMPDEMPETISEYLPESMSDMVRQNVRINMPCILPDGMSETMSEYWFRVEITRRTYFFLLEPIPSSSLPMHLPMAESFILCWQVGQLVSSAL